MQLRFRSFFRVSRNHNKGPFTSFVFSDRNWLFFLSQSHRMSVQLIHLRCGSCMQNMQGANTSIDPCIIHFLWKKCSRNQQKCKVWTSLKIVHTGCGNGNRNSNIFSIKNGLHWTLWKCSHIDLRQRQWQPIGTNTIHSFRCRRRSQCERAFKWLQYPFIAKSFAKSLSQSHNVNTYIESHTTHLLRHKIAVAIASCERTLYSSFALHTQLLSLKHSSSTTQR